MCKSNEAHHTGCYEVKTGHQSRNFAPFSTFYMSLHGIPLLFGSERLCGFYYVCETTTKQKTAVQTLRIVTSGFMWELLCKDLVSSLQALWLTSPLKSVRYSIDVDAFAKSSSVQLNQHFLTLYVLQYNASKTTMSRLLGTETTSHLDTRLIKMKYH